MRITCPCAAATHDLKITPSKRIAGGVVQTWSGAMRIYKLATQDGNYTVYRDGEALCCGLTRTVADALITQIAAAYARDR
jgi:hypothetical protein